MEWPIKVCLMSWGDYRVSAHSWVCLCTVGTKMLVTASALRQPGHSSHWMQFFALINKDWCLGPRDWLRTFNAIPCLSVKKRVYLYCWGSLMGEPWSENILTLKSGIDLWTMDETVNLRLLCLFRTLIKGPDFFCSKIRSFQNSVTLKNLWFWL